MNYVNRLLVHPCLSMVRQFVAGSLDLFMFRGYHVSTHHDFISAPPSVHLYMYMLYLYSQTVFIRNTAPYILPKIQYHSLGGTGLPTVTEFQYFVKEMRPWVRKFFWILAQNTEIFCYFSIIIAWKYWNFGKCYWKSWNYRKLLLK